MFNIFPTSYRVGQQMIIILQCYLTDRNSPLVRRHFVRRHGGRRGRLIVGGQRLVPGLLVGGQHDVHGPGPEVVVGRLAAVGVEQLRGRHGHHFFRFAGGRGLVDEARVHAGGPVALQIRDGEEQVAHGRRVHDVVDRERLLPLQLRRRDRPPPVALQTLVRRRQLQRQRALDAAAGRIVRLRGRRRRRGDRETAQRGRVTVHVRFHGDGDLARAIVLVLHVLAGRRRRERPLAAKSAGTHTHTQQQNGVSRRRRRSRRRSLTRARHRHPPPPATKWRCKERGKKDFGHEGYTYDHKRVIFFFLGGGTRGL